MDIQNKRVIYDLRSPTNIFIISFSVQLYMSIILLSMFLGSTSPLYFEMACEATYPVAEGVTNLVLTLVNNIGGLIFLVVQMVPHIGKFLKFTDTLK